MKSQLWPDKIQPLLRPPGPGRGYYIGVAINPSPEGEEGLKADDVKTYIRYIADRRLLQLGLKTNFKVKENPIPWLEWILNAADHTNFFENRVTEYEVAGLSGDWKDAYETKH